MISHQSSVTSHQSSVISHQKLLDFFDCQPELTSSSILQLRHGYRQNALAEGG
jgi:hypothetical protein